VNYDKVMAVGFQEPEPAHFTCAVMNSVYSRLVTRAYTNALSGLSTHVLENVNVPLYDSEDDIHTDLVALSKKAHETSDPERIDEIEAEINETARHLWNVSEEELQEIIESLEVLDS
jgi:broad specificity polyphosphatase/5'/3'-nucleotidase SurE